MGQDYFFAGLMLVGVSCFIYAGYLFTTLPPSPVPYAPESEENRIARQQEEACVVAAIICTM